MTASLKSGSADGLKLAADLQSLLDASTDAVLIVDRSGTVVALNRRTETLFGITADRVRGHSVDQLVPARMRERHAAARAAYARAPTARPMSTRGGLMGLRADGSEFAIEIALSPVDGPELGLVMAVVHEVGARGAIERPLEQSEEAAAALDAIPDAILTTDAAGAVDFLNRAAERLTGWDRAGARGRLLEEVFPLVPDEGGAALAHLMAGCLGGDSQAAGCEGRLPGRAGAEPRYLDVSTTPIRDRAGTPAGVAVLARDVTHARLIARELSHRATHDPLTGLVNRAEFERRLVHAVESAAEEGVEHALCFLDLDGFKRVNDACGHLAGDDLLRQLSDLMRERMRSRDTLARLGGDEFGMLLEHCRLATAARIADEIRKAVRAHRFVFGAETYTVGVSAGVVAIRPGSGDSASILRAADAACYRAKGGGGDRVQLADRRRRQGPAQRGRDWVARVRGAIEHHRFRLYAQPMVALGECDGHATWLELLLRLEDHDGEPFLPGAFLPAASRYGLMPAIDRWVIGQALQSLAEWRRVHPWTAAPMLAINLGAETVAEGQVASLVTMAPDGAPPGSLCFEISESVVSAHPASTLRVVRALRAAGCRTTLEHCGSGMAAFTLLRRLPVDFLKIAGTVVRGSAHDPVDRALVMALNEVGHALHLSTIGVEVESAELLTHLRTLGVDYAQGFGVGRPEPLETALERYARVSGAGPLPTRSGPYR